MARFAAALIVAGCWLAMPAFAAATESAPKKQAALELEMCAAATCQRDVRVALRREDGTLYDERFKVFPPTVQNMGIFVLAGQTIYIEAEVSGNRLINYVAVDKVKLPARTISAKLEQQADGSMLLAIHNPFAKAIKFNMGMMPLKSERLVKTTSCPVGAGLALYEHWPFPIFQVVLGGGRLLEEGDKRDCVN